MKTIVKKLLTVPLLLCVTASVYADSNSKKCKDKSFKGQYGYTESGEILGTGKQVNVGVFVSDGKGNIEGTGTMNLGSLGVLSVAFSDGTYSVNSNCTGTASFTATLTVLDGTPSGIPAGTIIAVSQRTLAFVLQKRGYMSFINADPDNIVIGTALKTKEKYSMLDNSCDFLPMDFCS